MSSILSTLHIATDLTTQELPGLASTIRDVLVAGKVYRRLNPDYYAWLRHKMDLAKSAFDRGRLPEPTFDALRDRFNAIHAQAIHLFGESTLLHAVWHLDPTRYPRPGTAQAMAHTETKPSEEARDSDPPQTRCSSDTPSIPGDPTCEDGWSDHEYPDDPGTHRHVQPVRLSAIAKVHAIEARAYADGWTQPELYQNRGRLVFPCGQDYGLVCFLQQDRTIGRITPRAIELICPAGHSLHFYRKGASS